MKRTFLPRHTGAGALSALPGILRLLLACLGLLSALSAPAAAREEILHFNSLVQVQPDASLIVTETIKVRAEGRNIRHGIYRDFPLYFKYTDGTRGKVGFKVLKVLRDGAPEPWFRKSVSNHARIYIGRKDALVSTGVHVYAITYRTTRQLRYFKDHDELYWNVTGNFWRFPIRAARAEVHLPKAARILNSALYLGGYGEARRAGARVVASRPGLFIAETTAPLGAREGFTIAISFPKGVVAEPSPMEKRLRRFWDRIGLWWLFFGSLGVTGYFLWIWNKVGRDPEPGAIFPRWEPPENLSPAGVAWLDSDKRLTSFDRERAFIAAITSLATKGYLRINEETGGKTMLVRLRRPDASLPPGEMLLMRKLFKSGETFTISRDSWWTLKDALKSFRDVLAGEYENVYVVRNRKWFFIGLGLAIAVALGFVFLSNASWEEWAEPAFLIFAFAIFAGYFGFMITGYWRRGDLLGKAAAIVIMAGLSLPLYLLFMGMFHGLLGDARFMRSILDNLPLILAILALPVSVMVFWRLLPRPTPEGRGALDALEGFRMYIGTAETERLNLPGAPRMSISTFEKFLPYAIALGLEEPWTKAFQAWLATAAASGAAAFYRPAWYGGRVFRADGIGDFGSSLVSGISRDMASAMPVKSSSGSGGGGFSGGGGGGGGGGGW